MPVTFGGSSGTDYTFDGGTANGAKTLSRPSGSTTDDLVVLLRHHSASNVAFSSGSTDGNLNGSSYIATGSTASMAQYRKITSGSDQSAGWGWTSSGSSWCHAGIRFSGVDHSGGNPFAGGTNNGGTLAGDFVLGNGTSITLAVGSGAANNMGVVFCTSTQPVSTVSSGWTKIQLGSSPRYMTLIYRAYTETVSSDTCTVTFGSNSAALGRHGIIAGVAGGTDATATVSTVTSTAAVPTVVVSASSPNATVTPAAVSATALARSAVVTTGGLYRVTVVGDSLTEGSQVGAGNRWQDLLFGSQGAISNGVWWNGAASGVPFPGKRLYAATYQGDSVIETTNRSYPNAKTDISADAYGRTTDLMIIMLGANDELDSLPGGITQATNNSSTSSTNSMQWVEDNVVQLANGGIQSGTVGANPANVNNLPKPKYVLVVGQWEWRAGSIPTAGVAGNPATHAWTLARLQAAVTRIAALTHIEWAGYVEVASHAHLGAKASGGGMGVDTAQCPTGGYGYDTIHPSVSGQANVYAPTIRWGVERLISETGMGTPATVTPAAVGATGTVSAATVTVNQSATITPAAIGVDAAVPPADRGVPTIMGTPVTFGGAPPSYRYNTITVPTGIQVGELVVLVVRVQGAGTTFDGSVGTDWDLLVDMRDAPASNRGMVVFGWRCVNQAAVDAIVDTAPILGTPGGTRSVYSCFRVAGVPLDEPVGSAATAGANTSSATSFTVPKYNFRLGEQVVTAFGTESTSGQPVAPTSVSWGALTQLTTLEEPTGPTGSHTSLSVYTAPIGTPPPTPSQSATYPSTVAVLGGMSWTLRGKAQAPVLPGVPTVAELTNTTNFRVGHRGSSRNWPEFSMYSYIEAARYGVQALEISLNRTSDGVWFGMHDADLGRVSGDALNTDPTTLTWADLTSGYQILGSTASLDPTQPDRPFARFEDIAAAFPHHVLIIDPKYRWSSSERAEFFALLAAHGGGQRLDGTTTTAQERCIIKSYCASVGVNGVGPLAAAAGYTTWGYFYPADFTNWATYEPYWDWLSLDSTVTAPNWVTAVATGKPVVGHVIGTQTDADLVVGYGAQGVMCSNIRNVATPVSFTNASVAASSVTAAGTVPPATFAGSSPATVAVSSVAVTVGIQSPTLTATRTAVVTPLPVTVTGQARPVTVAAGGSTTVPAGAVDAAATVQPATVTTTRTATTTVSAVATSAAVPTVTVTAGGSITIPTVPVAAVGTVPAVGVSTGGSVTVAASPVVVAATSQSVGMSTGAMIAAALVAATLSVRPPVVVLPGDITATLWDGTTWRPATATLWDGTTERSIVLEVT